MPPSLRMLVRDGLRRTSRHFGSAFKTRHSATTDRRILFVTADNRILRSQVNPFRRGAAAIQARHGAMVHELDIGRFDQWSRRPHPTFDTIVLQPWFDIEPSALEGMIARCRDLGAEHVVFMDGFAPTDLRFAAVLDGKIDLYVKKHVLRDRTAYGKPTIGDTNLTDHFARRYGIDLPVQQFPVSADILDRLVVGPTFFTDDAMWERLLEPPSCPKRDIDVHARLGAGNDWGWYSRMRAEAIQALTPLADLRIVQGDGVKNSVYMSELARSKTCFSPFGFGEVAWRDFEAVTLGSLLLKPDCSHIDIQPDIFVPFETFVPLRWDFADLEDKVRHYLADDGERSRITGNARLVLEDYVRSDAFLRQMQPVLAGSRSQPLSEQP